MVDHILRMNKTPLEPPPVSGGVAPIRDGSEFTVFNNVASIDNAAWKMTTSGTHRIVLALIVTAGTSSDPPTIASVEGETIGAFTLRKRYGFTGASNRGNYHANMEMWSALAENKITSELITATPTGTCESASMFICAYSGCKLIAPFDPNASLSSAQAHGIETQPVSISGASISNSGTMGIAFGLNMTNAGINPLPAPAKWGTINSGGASQEPGIFISQCDQAFTEPQAGTLDYILTQIQPPWGDWGIMLDALTSPTSDYVGPGDLQPGALGFWSYMAYSAATIGMDVIRLRRASDNALQTFATQDDGCIDLAAVAAFQGASTLWVDTVYDQSGHQNHATQAETTQQLQFLLGGGPDGVLPCFKNTQALEWLYCDKNLAELTPYILSIAFKAPFANVNIYMGIGGHCSFMPSSPVNSGDIGLFAGGWVNVTGTGSPSTPSDWQSVLGCVNAASSFINLNGTETPGGDSGMVFDSNWGQGGKPHWVGLGASAGADNPSWGASMLEWAAWNGTMTDQAARNAYIANQASRFKFP